MSAKNWTREMNKMLANVENEVTNALYNIDQSGQSFNEDFKAYFFESLNDRLMATYSKVEKELKMKKTLAGASTHSTQVKSELDNNAQNVIEIDDSSDEEGASQTARTSNKSVQVATTHSISCAVSSNANARDTGNRLEQGKGSTVIRHRQLNTVLNEPTTNDDDELVGLGADTQENSGQQTNEQEATNSTQNRSPMDTEGENSMVNDRIGTSSGDNVQLNNTDAAKKDQSNPTIHPSNKNVHNSKAALEKTAAKGAKKASGHVNTNKFKCRLCDYASCYMGNLNVHMRTHTDEKPYRCDRCEKRFSRRDHLKLHATTHADGYPFSCKGCFRRFAQKAEKDAHDKECKARRYECHLCRKFVTQSITNMKNHMQSHTGEKPFRCEICIKCFTRKGNLKKHLDNVHGKMKKGKQNK